MSANQAPSSDRAGSALAAGGLAAMLASACCLSATVKKALSRIEGVSDVAVNYPKRQALVIFDDSKTTVDALTRATTDAGYSSTVKEGSTK